MHKIILSIVYRQNELRHRGQDRGYLWGRRRRCWLGGGTRGTSGGAGHFCNGLGGDYMGVFTMEKEHLGSAPFSLGIKPYKYTHTILGMYVSCPSIYLSVI